MVSLVHKGETLMRDDTDWSGFMDQHEINKEIVETMEKVWNVEIHADKKTS